MVRTDRRGELFDDLCILNGRRGARHRARVGAVMISEVQREQLAVLNRMIDERARQEDLKRRGKFLFSCADHPGLNDTQKLLVLVEEVGEVAQVILNLQHLAKDWKDELAAVGFEERHLILKAKLEEEVTQVAAVAMAWLESIERRR